MTVVSARRPLWRQRDFNLYWTGQTASDIGAQVATIALPLLVLSWGLAPSTAGAAATVYLVTATMLRLPAGALVDRWNRRRVMLVSDGVQFSSLAALAVISLTDLRQPALVLACAAVTAAAGTFFSSAESGALRRLVPPEQLGDALARNEAREYAAGLAGPSLGGALFAVARAMPFLAAVAASCASFVTVALIRTPMQESSRTSLPKKALLDEIGDGLRFVLGQPYLRAMVAIAVPINAVISGAMFGSIVVLKRADVQLTMIGLCQGIIAAGGLLGAVIAPILMRRIAPGTLVRLMSFATTPAMLLTALLADHVYVVAPLAMLFLLVPAANAALFAHQMSVTPESLQGRVASTIVFSAQGMAALAPVVVGTVITLAGTWAAFSGLAALAMISVAAACTAKDLSKL